MDRRYDWRLLRYDHVERSAWFDRFHWQTDSELRAQLRSASGLEAQLGAAEPPWQQILSIMHWVHGLSEHSEWDEAPDLSALSLLADVQAGRIAFRCLEYAHMLQQVLAAFGFTARVVGLRRESSDQGLGKAHVVVDVFSPEHVKWVELDPQFDTAYQDLDGRLLSALEVHDLLRSGRLSRVLPTADRRLRAGWTDVSAKDTSVYAEIDVAEGFQRDEFWDMLPEHGDYESFWRHWIANHYHLTYGMQLGLVRPKATAQDETLFLYEPGDLPPIAFQRLRQNVIFTRDRASVEFPVDGVELQWTVAEAGEDMPLAATRHLTLHMRHSMPWFDHFLVSLDGKEALVRQPSCPVSLHQGENDIRVTPVNDVGRPGSEARLVIEVP